MSESQAVEAKPSFWQTVRVGWRPYRRLYSYVKPYRVRFVLGIALGIASGLISSALPLVLAKVTSIVFHGGGPTDPKQFVANPSMLNTGAKVTSSILWWCLAIPAIMSVRSLFAYGNVFCMSWVSNRVVTDIRDKLFTKMLYHSMDFFNRMHSGFLMSRITNDTRGM